MRVGFGYDVHRLVPGRPLILGGIEIPYECGLLGHSDADVLLHAICDALIGAAALGDIGTHFPDTSPEFKDISSLILLNRTAALLNRAGVAAEKYRHHHRGAEAQAFSLHPSNGREDFEPDRAGFRLRQYQSQNDGDPGICRPRGGDRGICCRACRGICGAIRRRLRPSLNGFIYIRQMINNILVVSRKAQKGIGCRWRCRSITL